MIDRKIRNKWLIEKLLYVLVTVSVCKFIRKWTVQNVDAVWFTITVTIAKIASNEKNNKFVNYNDNDHEKNITSGVVVYTNMQDKKL